MAPSPPPKGRLGSSVDQDGKSNIWAVEPKMAVDQDAGASGGGIIAVGGELPRAVLDLEAEDEDGRRAERPRRLVHLGTSSSRDDASRSSVATTSR